MTDFDDFEFAEFEENEPDKSDKEATIKVSHEEIKQNTETTEKILKNFEEINHKKLRDNDIKNIECDLVNPSNTVSILNINESSLKIFNNENIKIEPKNEIGLLQTNQNIENINVNKGHD